MRVLTFRNRAGVQCLGVLVDGERVLNATAAWPHGLHAPDSVSGLIAAGEPALEILKKVVDDAGRGGSVLVAFADTDVLAPIPRTGRNVFCIGRNYREHIIEGNLANGRPADNFPVALEIFTKPTTAIIGHRAGVKRHAQVTELLDYEVELGVIIGKGGVNIRAEDALAHVFGYTVINDVTARDLQRLHGQWFKGKSLDASCPIGPVVALAEAIDDPQALRIELDVNGERRQDANTSDMLFSIAQIIEQLSAGMSIEPGDIIATGTPSGVGFARKPPVGLKVGDVMRARIERIGELENDVVE